MKKKVLSVLMVFMMCLGLAGWGGGSNSASDDISGKVSLSLVTPFSTNTFESSLVQR